MKKIIRNICINCIEIFFQISRQICIKFACNDGRNLAQILHKSVNIRANRVIRGFADFKRGRTSTNGAERSGHPNLVIVPEKKVHKMVLADHKLKSREIAEP